MPNKETLYLVRHTPKDEDGIYGKLHIPEYRIDNKRVVRLFDTLERPWLDNKVSESAIPTGTYPLRQLKGRGLRYPGLAKKYWKHKFVPHIDEVPGRTGILIHWGNWVGDVTGCCLVGERMDDMGDKFLGNSKQTYVEVYKLIEELYAEFDELEIVVQNKKHG